MDALSELLDAFSVLKPGAVLQAASHPTVDSVFEWVAALYEAALTSAAAPVLLSSVLGNVADVLVEVVLEMVALEVEVVAVQVGIVAVHLLAVSLDLLLAVVQLEVAALSLEIGAVDVVVSGVELEDLVVNLEMVVVDLVGVVTVESEVAAVSDLPTSLEEDAIVNGPTVVFEMISALSSLSDESGDFEALIWASFDSVGTLVALEVVSVIDVVTEDDCASESSESSVSIFTTSC